MKPLSLSVVGHTNTGKTSLLRTLLRDVDFGDIQDEAATTRHVEQATIHDGDIPLIHLYDTPGLEDATAVLNWLEKYSNKQHDGIERIKQFLNSEIAQNTLNQEAKVLRQLLASHAALYVIDIREPVLPKYKDELRILAWCAKPIMPVFNFLNTHQHKRAWQEMLARCTLHVHSGFDTVAFDFQSEITLWKNLQTMLPEKQLLQHLIESRQRDWQQIENYARIDIARFLIDIAAYQHNAESITTTFAYMQKTVREHEQNLHNTLLNHYRLYRNEIPYTNQELHFIKQDPFDPELWKSYGIRTGKGAAFGALVGLGIDILALGSSLGMGTAIGSMIGGILPNKTNISNALSGKNILHIDNASITLLAARTLDLLNLIQQRGHAAQDSLVLTEKTLPWSINQLPDILQKARQQEKWSTLNNQTNSAPQTIIHTLAQQLPFITNK